MLHDFVVEYPVGGAALFWSLTMKGIDLHMRAAAERSRRAHNDRAWLAFNIANLPNQKPPMTLRQLQMHKSPGQSSQTPEDRLRMVRMLAHRR